MPRPKPPLPLRKRNIRLDDEQWAELQARGGPAWLRKQLQGTDTPAPAPAPKKSPIRSMPAPSWWGGSAPTKENHVN